MTNACTAAFIAVLWRVFGSLFIHRRESSSTLVQFPQYAETAGNSQKLDIDLIQTYVTGELQRQNNAANQTKHLCEMKLIQLQNQLEDVNKYLNTLEIVELNTKYT